MGGTTRKKASPWPELEFLQDANLRTHTKEFINEALKVEAIAEETRSIPPFAIFIALLKSAISLAQSQGRADHPLHDEGTPRDPHNPEEPGRHA